MGRLFGILSVDSVTTGISEVEAGGRQKSEGWTDPRAGRPAIAGFENGGRRETRNVGGLWKPEEAINGYSVDPPEGGPVDTPEFSLERTLRY